MSSCNNNRYKTDKEMNSIVEVERSIIKKYRKQIYSPFIKAIKDYEMIKDNDHIAVCISGGKDSLLLAKCLEILQRYSDIDFKVSYIAMNPGFSDDNYQLLVNNCQKLGIKVKIFDTDIFAVANKISKDYPCYICAKRRRGALYNFAQELGCNKIALGHHFDDIIETTMLNVLYAGCYGAMLPRIYSDNYEGMELIRPLCYVREKDIINYTLYNHIQPMNCGCQVAAKKTSSKRRAVKELLATLRNEDPLIDKSIFASMRNVNLDTVESFRYQQQRYNYLHLKEDNDK